MDKKYTLLAFGLLAIVQLYAPAKMILDREVILDEGKAFKFVTAPIDPSDPFRGKYVALSFKDNNYIVANDSLWKSGETVYVTFKDSLGFAKINAVLKDKPQGTTDYLKTTINYVLSYQKPYRLDINFPFNRFYMEESKAPKAEKAYAETSSDSTKHAYAIVHIKEGDAVLKDVILDGIPIKEAVKKGP